MEGQACDTAATGGLQQEEELAGGGKKGGEMDIALEWGNTVKENGRGEEKEEENIEKGARGQVALRLQSNGRLMAPQASLNHGEGCRYYSDIAVRSRFPWLPFGLLRRGPLYTQGVSMLDEHLARSMLFPGRDLQSQSARPLATISHLYSPGQLQRKKASL
ncbi:hypothetical protein NQZ68_000990 [Dissostichus eleginoides]|nr:hypothetical protein NQZ68_000990 [Dissostichus eleginoides]